MPVTQPKGKEKMIRNLKILGVVTGVVFALSVVLASMASAQVGTLTSTGPVTLDGVSRTGEVGTNTFTESFPKQGVITSECSGTKYTGHRYNVTPHTLIPSDTSAFTLTSGYLLCSMKMGTTNFPMTVDMNGCSYSINFEGTTPGVDTYTAKTTIGSCPTGKHITFTIWKTETEHKEGKTPFCAITITENEAGYLGLHATDTTEGDIQIKGTIEGLVLDKTSPTSSILCPTEADSNGKLDVDWTWTGTNEEGSATSIGLSHL